MKTIKLLFVMIVSVTLASCNSNSNRSKEAKTMNDKTMVMTNTDKDSDADFVKEAANGGMMEVELGRYAEQNAQHPRVKNFGAMMVRDHTKANQDLKTIATNKNIPVPETMGDDKDKMNDLQKKTGADFDKDYISNMVDDHQKDIDKFKKEAENGRDPDLKSFAAQALPILQAHLDSAKNIKDALK